MLLRVFFNLSGSSSSYSDVEIATICKQASPKAANVLLVTEGNLRINEGRERSSPKGANISKPFGLSLVFAPFGDADMCGSAYPQVTFTSLTPPAVKHIRRLLA